MQNRKKTQNNKKNEGLQFYKEVQQKNFLYHRIFVLGGRERFLLDQCCFRINNYFKSRLSPMDYKFADAKKVSANKLLNFCRQLPASGNNSFLYVVNAEKLPPSFWAGLTENRFDGLCAVFAFSELLGSIRNTVGSSLKVVDFSGVFGTELVNWSKKVAKDSGKKIYAEQVRRLIQAVGYDLATLRNELEKCCMISSTDKITDEEIDDVVDFYSTDEQKILDRILSFRLKEALELIDQSTAFNFDRICNLLKFQLELLYKVIKSRDSLSFDEMKDRFNLTGFRLYKAMQTVSNFSEYDLIRAYGLVIDMLTRKSVNRFNEKNSFRRIVLLLGSS